MDDKVSETGPALTFRQSLTWTAHLFKAVIRQYHKDLGAKLAPLIARDAVIVDVGAHSGQHSKLFAGMAPDGHVYAFEPGAYARSILSRMVRLRGLSNVTVVPFGMSDKASTETLHVPLKRSGTMGFGLSHIGADNDDGRATATETIQLTTLDIFAEAQKLTRLDFVKVDIEGWEAHFLKGALGTIKRLRPIVLIEVVEHVLARAGTTPADIFDAMAPLDYVAFENSEHDGYVMRRVEGFRHSMDIMFVPSEKAHLVDAE
ncbi:MAG: FkbM family methyltransferase [Parvibaculum sp.]|nr:FkbM family methyltransferase [Parvibaculum sp.]